MNKYPWGESSDRKSNGKGRDSGERGLVLLDILAGLVIASIVILTTYRVLHTVSSNESKLTIEQRETRDRFILDRPESDLMVQTREVVELEGGGTWTVYELEVAGGDRLVVPRFSQPVDEGDTD